MGRQQAGFDVSDPGRPQCNCDRHTRRKIHGRERRGEKWREHLRVRLQGYKDWNNPLNPAEALYAGKMTEKKNGTVTRDITTTLTETGQMYVVVPVPASVKAAIKPTNHPPNWTLTPNAPPATQTAAAVTPRLANGKPDMTGIWGGAANPITGGGNRRCGPTQVGCDIPRDNFWVDYEWI